MSMFKKTALLLLLTFTCNAVNPNLEAVTYVTDAGGYAYDDSRAATNYAPAIALATVGIGVIVALGIQNSSDSSRGSSSHYGSYFDSSSSSSYSSH